MELDFTWALPPLLQRAEAKESLKLVDSSIPVLDVFLRNAMGSCSGSKRSGSEVSYS